MDQQTFFGGEAPAPLAARLRPETLDDFVGQRHLLGPGKVLRRLIETDGISSMISGARRASGKRRSRTSSPNARRRSLSIFRPSPAALRKSAP